MFVCYTLIFFLLKFPPFFWLFSYFKSKLKQKKFIFLPTLKKYSRKLVFKKKKPTTVFSFFSGKKSLGKLIKFKTLNLLSLYNCFLLSKINLNFLRKNKFFNKGRYSRNRQYYRTGVYWCLYVNIILIFGFYFWFYNLTLNFSYIWWLMYFFFCLFIFPTLVNLWNKNSIRNIFYKYLIWLSLLLKKTLPIKLFLLRKNQYFIFLF